MIAPVVSRLMAVGVPARGAAGRSVAPLGARRLRYCVLVVGVAVVTLAGSLPSAAAAAVGEDRDGRLPAVVAAGGFSDAAEAGVHSEAVNSLAADGVFEGTECAPGRFCPGEPLKRWVMAIWLVRILDGEDPSSVSVSLFADVDSGEWWAPFVERLADLGVTAGCKTDPLRYCPDDTVTRAQMASFLTRAFRLEAASQPVGFVDVGGDAHEDNINALASAGITAGCATGPLRYCPGKAVTRAQMASFLSRARGGGAVAGPLEVVDYQRINELLSSLGALDATEGCPATRVPASVEDHIEVMRIDDGCVIIEYEPLDGRTVAEARRVLASDPTVVAADLPVVDFDLTHDYSADDPDAGRQWHLPQVDAKALWDGWPDGAEVTVAVIDSGVDGTHRDLQPNLVGGGLACHRRDYHGHGTHVAGIAGAVAANGIAVAGIAPRARILPIKLPLNDVPPDPECDQAIGSLTHAIEVAVENGADVINMSLGRIWYWEFPTTLAAAIHLATTSGVVLVAAAGNRGNKLAHRNAPEVPAIHSDVISVAATTEGLGRAGFSTSNRWVNVAAPGNIIYSTVPCDRDDCGTGIKSGTSMATPLVSGVVAHMKARYPDAAPAEIRKAIYDTARQPGSDRSRVRSDDFGWGIIQPHAAIEALAEMVGDTNAAPQFTSTPQMSVAENTTGVGSVTAIDEDDNITGYHLSGGDDRDLFEVTGAGAIDFIDAPDYESSSDADGDNTYEVTVSVTSGLGNRARTSNQSILVTVTDTDEPPETPAAPTLDPAAAAIAVSWLEPGGTGPPVDDYDVQFRELEATDPPDDGVETSNWRDVGRDLWNVGCDIWDTIKNGANSDDAARDLWNETWDNAGEAGSEAGSYIADGLFDGAPSGTGWDDIWDGGCEIWRDVGEAGLDAWEKIWEAGKELRDIGKRIGGWFVDLGRGVWDIFKGIWGVFKGIGRIIGDLFFSASSGWSDWSHTGSARESTVVGLTAATAYEVRVRAANPEGTSDWSAAAAALTVTNAPPAFTSRASMEIPENTTSVGTVTATDPDSGDSIVAYNISGGNDENLLTIDQNTGALVFRAAPDYEAPADHNRDNTYDIAVTVTSGTGQRELTATQNVIIGVTDDTSEAGTRLPDPPSLTVTGTTGTSLTLGWQQPVGPPIEDYDIQYRAVGTNAWADWPHTGTVRTATVAGLTEGTAYEIRIRAANTEGTGEWSRPVLATTTGNREPQFTSRSTLTVPEHTQQIAEVTAVDPDPEDTVNSYGITGGADRALLTIDGAGTLAFTEPPDYETPQDADRNNRYEVVVAATSGTGTRLKTATQRIMISIADDTAETPPTPTSRYEWDGSSIVLSWDAVEDADYYNVYYDDFFASGCRVRRGSASFCEELATNVTATGYTHTDPDADANYYWVVACNSSGCSPVDSANPARTVGTPPPTPAARYEWDGSSIVVSWDAVADADYYNVYYDDFFGSSCTVRRGSASFCEELATNVTATSYTHADPDTDDNYYWVVACNSSGCSPVDSANPATTTGTAPATPAARYEWDGSSIVVSWDAVADADYYNVYYDDFFGSSCTVRRGSASFCEELATNVTATSYTHADPDTDDNYYWVVACNSSGCSPVDSANPATTTGTAPATPAARYEWDGSSIVVSWDAVADADYYNVYYDDFFGSSCTVRRGSASFCEELATNITTTSYTHADPDSDANYYWVVACNNAGCSPVDSANPATTVGTAPTTPTARYEWDGSSIVVSWDAVADADYYNVYYDDFFASGCTVRRGSASFCEELATNVTATTYTHADPDSDSNYYWVVACNGSGCSPVDSANPATTTGSPPITPTARYEWDGSSIVVSWDAVEDADYYNVYYDDFFASGCTVRRGSASFCEELATNVTVTTYTHADPDSDSNYYWVVACNSSGCSPVDSANPATTTGTAPATPTASYEWDGSSIVVSWDAVADASFYNVYYDDFFGSSCTVRRGSASFCEELATNITATSYTHADPDPDNNYYWVIACNSSGCSAVDSANPASTEGTAPVTPAARYDWDGSSIVLSWDAVVNADYYNVYYDEFFAAACTVWRGSASFCQELAANVTATSYTHTNPDPDANYYWVVACNNSGCSSVDSTNPVTVTDSPPVTVSACINESGPPPLHQSVTDGDTELATTLAELCKEHLNTEYSYGFRLDETPLSLAVKAQATEIVRILVDTGADPNKETQNGFRLYLSPLEIANERGYTEIINILTATQ